MKNSENVKTYWDKVASQTRLHDTAMVGMLADYNLYNAIYRDETEKQRFAELIKLGSKMNVVEIGTGGGRWALWLSEKVRHVHATDISLKMIKLAKASSSRANRKNISFNVGTLPTDQCVLSDAHVIYLSGVCQYIDDTSLSNLIRNIGLSCRQDVIIVSRDTLIDDDEIKMTGEYPVIYRNVDKFKEFFENEGFFVKTVINAYDSRPFSGMIGKVYARLNISYRVMKKFHDTVIVIDKFTYLFTGLKIVWSLMRSRSIQENTTEKLQKFIIVTKNDSK